MTNYYTPVVADEEVDPAALNTRFTQLDDQIFAMAGGTGYEDQNANRVLAGPGSGSPAAPTFRALVAADLSAALTTPPAIGGTTPAAGTFTTLTANTVLNSPGTGLRATFGNGLGEAGVNIEGAAGFNRLIRFRTGTSNRWAIATEDSAESGSNAGSNFRLSRYSDAGTFLDQPFQVLRSNGTVRCLYEIEIDGAFNHDGSTFGALGATPIARPTVSGSRGGNAALASLCTALANLGLITNSTS